MFKNVSWSEYWIFLTTILIIYYAAVCFRFYYPEILAVLSGRSNPFLNIKLAHKSNANQNSNNKRSFEQYMHPEENLFVAEIETTLLQAAKNNSIKQEILYALQQLSIKHSAVKDSPFKPFISNYILIECSNYCSIQLSEDELNMLWEK